MPLHRWAREVWFLHCTERPRDALAYKELCQAWACREASGKAWARRRGASEHAPNPLGAIVAAIARLRWTWEAPHLFRSDQGDVLDLTYGHPQQLRHHVAQGLMRSVAAEAHPWVHDRLEAGQRPSHGQLAQVLQALVVACKPKEEVARP
jgi:hypothetical protein